MSKKQGKSVMRFPVKEILTEAGCESGLKAVVRDGFTSQSMATLTVETFLVALALKLGGSNLVIGLLAANNLANSVAAGIAPI